MLIFIFTFEVGNSDLEIYLFSAHIGVNNRAN